LAHDFTPGEQLGRYTLERVLGGGGFATVWRARAEGPGGFERAVAVKVIRPGRASQKRFRDMLLDEARLVARIQHPNVAQVWEVGEDPRSLYIVMEMVDGASLEDLRECAEERGEKLSVRSVFRVLSDTCAGLHAAHELEADGGTGELLGLVHRDISPHNILVSRHGIAKLIDFGIAKAKERISGETTTGIIKGKISFMAPEQARAEPTVDRRVDVWAIGAVAFELLEGRPPFDAATDIGRLAAVAGPAEAPPMSEEVPPALRRVVARALAKDADDRYPTALALKEAIDEALIESELETSTQDVAEEVAPLLGPRAGLASVPPRRGEATASASTRSPAPVGATELAEGTAERGMSSTILAARSTDEVTLPRRQGSKWTALIAASAVSLPLFAWWATRDGAEPTATAAAPNQPASGASALTTTSDGASTAAREPVSSAQIETAAPPVASGDAAAPTSSASAAPSASVAPIVQPAKSAHPTTRPAVTATPRQSATTQPSASPRPVNHDDDAIE
jgi:eukaryotic-like serine/threonine-protein kinase